jgi:predicted Rossmann fold nucleotide-binding protein DprA/Smf involved in DNA uptake
MRVPFLDTDRNTEDWRERRKQELARVRVRWDRADRQTTNFNGFMEEDRFVALSDAQAVLIAIGALEEDELGEQAQAEEFAVDRVAAKLGWPIKQTLDGVCSLEERGFVEVCH